MCVCVCVCIYVCICVHMCVYVYAFVSLYLCVSYFISPRSLLEIRVKHFAPSMQTLHLRREMEMNREGWWDRGREGVCGSGRE
jgi:hypothetical protein